VIVPNKFEVRSFTRSWDKREYSKNLEECVGLIVRAISFQDVQPKAVFPLRLRVALRGER